VAVISAVPTINIPPAAAAAAAASAATDYDPSNYDPSDSFKPWDSRPIELGDDEDWLR
jgi:hypothetical protein